MLLPRECAERLHELPPQRLLSSLVPRRQRVEKWDARSFGCREENWWMPLDKEEAGRTVRTPAPGRPGPWGRAAASIKVFRRRPELSPAEHRSGARWAAAEWLRRPAPE